jgi:hypothetical protein
VKLSDSLQRQLDAFSEIDPVLKKHVQNLIDMVRENEAAAAAAKKNAEQVAHFQKLMDDFYSREQAQINEQLAIEEKRNSELDKFIATMEKDYVRVFGEANDASIELYDKLGTLNEAFVKGIITEQELEKFTALANRMHEARNGIVDFNEVANSVAKNMAQNLGGAVDDMINSFGEAKFSFSQFAESFMKDIARMISQALIFQPLMNSLKGFDFGSMFGFAKGGSFGNLGLPQGVYNRPMAFPMAGTQPRAFAHGGTFGVMAERGAEAIVPLKRTASGDLGVRSSPVIVNVNNSTQAEVSVQQNQGPDGATVLNIMVEKKVREMLGKGNLDRQMMVQYGLTRQPA